MASPVVLIFVRRMTAPKCYMLPKFGENSTCSCKASKFSSHVTLNDDGIGAFQNSCKQLIVSTA